MHRVIIHLGFPGHVLVSGPVPVKFHECGFCPGFIKMLALVQNTTFLHNKMANCYFRILIFYQLS